VLERLPDLLPVGRAWLADAVGPFLQTSTTIMPWFHPEPMQSAQRYGPFRPAPSTALVDSIVAAKRDSVGIASTVLDRLPGTRTEDTSVILNALGDARLVLQAIGVATGQVAHADLLARLRDAEDRVRAAIMAPELRT
jgi:hypothetical protein